MSRLTVSTALLTVALTFGNPPSGVSSSVPSSVPDDAVLTAFAFPATPIFDRPVADWIFPEVAAHTVAAGDLVYAECRYGTQTMIYYLGDDPDSAVKGWIDSRALRPTTLRECSAFWDV